MPKKNEFISEFKAVESAYLNGMKDVLNEIATLRYLDLLGPSSQNPRIQESWDESLNAYNDLYKVLDDNQRELLGRIEETFNLQHSYEDEERYVQGFLEGYKFIKELYSSGGGIMISN